MTLLSIRWKNRSRYESNRIFNRYNIYAYLSSYLKVSSSVALIFLEDADLRNESERFADRMTLELLRSLR